MRRNLFTDNHAQKVAIITPKANITIAVIINASHDNNFVISGSFSYRRHIPIPKTAIANRAETNPSNTARRKNGARIKLHEPPTSFIVWIEKRCA